MAIERQESLLSCFHGAHSPDKPPAFAGHLPGMGRAHGGFNTFTAGIRTNISFAIKHDGDISVAPN